MLLAFWGQAVLVRWVVIRGIGPARAGKLGGVWAFRAVREGERVIASSACSGPVPLLLGDVRGDVRGDVVEFLGQAPLGGLEFGDRLLCVCKWAPREDSQ